MNAVIACGGTGGHLFPGIAVAEVMCDRGHEVMLLISEKDIDALALSGRTNFRVEKLPTIGRPNTRNRDVYSRIECCPWKGEPTNGADGAGRHAGLQGVRAVFSKIAHGSDRHASADGISALGPARCSPKARTSRGCADVACDGGQPGRQRNQSGANQIAAIPARSTAASDP